jgi:hypothetical protein
VELHPAANQPIHDYPEAAGHGAGDNGALFRPIRNNRTGQRDKALTPDMIYTGAKIIQGSRLQNPRLCAALDRSRQRARQ